MVSPPPATDLELARLVSRAADRRDRRVPASKGGISKAPKGPFQTSVRAYSSKASTRRSISARYRESYPRGRPRSTSTTLGRRMGCEFRRDDDIDRQDDFAIRVGRLGHDLPGDIGEFHFAERFADRLAHARREMCSPCRRRSRDRSTRRMRLPRSSSLVETFAPPTTAMTGRTGMREKIGQDLQLDLHRAAGDRTASSAPGLRSRHAPDARSKKRR